MIIKKTGDRLVQKNTRRILFVMILLIFFNIQAIPKPKLYNPFSRPDNYVNVTQLKLKRKKEKTVKKKKYQKKQIIKIDLIVATNDNNSFFISKKKHYMVGDYIGQEEVISISPRYVTFSNGVEEQDIQTSDDEKNKINLRIAGDE